MNSCKFLILGNGFIGNKLNKYFEDSVLSPKRINSKEDVIEEINQNNPKIVINCIGKTGSPNIDWCEDNKKETIESNILVPLHIAEACKEKGIKMVHIGSGCIYQGDKDGAGFSEDDEPNYYGSFYSITKIISEKMLNKFDNVLQIRIRMPLSAEKSQRNLITKLLGYKKIISVKNSISILEDTTDIIKKLVDLNQTGIFNVVNKGAVNHEELLSIYEEISGIKLGYEVISTEDLNKMTKAGRSNCILSTNKLESIGISPKNTLESLRKIIKNYIENN